MASDDHMQIIFNLGTKLGTSRGSYSVLVHFGRLLTQFCTFFSNAKKTFELHHFAHLESL